MFYGFGVEKEGREGEIPYGKEKCVFVCSNFFRQDVGKGSLLIGEKPYSWFRQIFLHSPFSLLLLLFPPSRLKNSPPPFPPLPSPLQDTCLEVWREEGFWSPDSPFAWTFPNSKGLRRQQFVHTVLSFTVANVGIKSPQNLTLILSLLDKFQCSKKSKINLKVCFNIDYFFSFSYLQQPFVLT